MNTKSRILIGTVLVLVNACTWVKPVPEAAGVGLVKPNAAQQCKKLGITTVRIKHRLGPIARSKKKVQDELIAMAKNDAAVMGGNIISVASPASEGQQKFTIFKCE